MFTNLKANGLKKPINEIILRISLDGLITYCDSNTESIYGYLPQELIDLPYAILLPRENLDRYSKVFKTVLLGKQIKFEESHRLLKNHTKVKVSVSYSSIKDGLGNIVGIAASECEYSDITQNNYKFQTLVEIASDAMVIVNSDGQIVLMNKKAEVLFGYSKDDLIDQDINTLIPNRYRLKNVKLHNYFFFRPQSRDQQSKKELYGLKKDGSEFPIEICYAPLNIDGSILISTAIKDISLRKQAEEKFKRLLEAAPDAMVIVNEQGEIILINGRAEYLFGYTREELIGQKIEILIPDKYRTIHSHHRNDYANSPKLRPMGVNMELEGKKKNGEHFPVEVSLSPIQEDNELIISAAIRDISERKYLKQLEQKNRELEQFAYIASHDLKEPLHTIQSLVTLLHNDYHQILGEEGSQYLSYIIKSSNRMEQLVKELLQYSRIGSMRSLSIIDCNKLVDEVITDLDAQIKKSNAQIKVGKLPEIEGFEMEIRQLFQNLLSNAIKFRKLNITPEIEVSCSKKNDENTFSIKDNGIGIDVKYFENIFVIFKRLHVREKYEGTGIGLAHCKKIVELHGGKIWVESNLDKGSNFLFTL